MGLGRFHRLWMSLETCGNLNSLQSAVCLESGRSNGADGARINGVSGALDLTTTSSGAGGTFSVPAAGF
jgi:hypothetical protein